VKPAVGFTLPSAEATSFGFAQDRLCTQYKSRNVEDAISLSGSLRGLWPNAGEGPRVGGWRGREFTSPVHLRERRPAASRPAGEGAGRKLQVCDVGVRFFLWTFFSCVILERSEESRILLPHAEASALLAAWFVRD
jgi:hypothetical protein